MRGTGITTRLAMSELHAKLCAQFVRECNVLGASTEDMRRAAFSDGMRAMRTQLAAMGVIVIVDETAEQTADTQPPPESR